MEVLLHVLRILDRLHVHKQYERVGWDRFSNRFHSDSPAVGVRDHLGQANQE